MYLTKPEQTAVQATARSYGIDGESEELVRDALSAICLGQADETAYRVAESAGIGFIDTAIWYKKGRDMDAQKARAILAEAQSHDTYEDTIPEDDEQAIKEAEELVNMAETAWEQHVRGPEVEAILRMAAEGNGSGPSEEEEPSDRDVAEEPHGEAERKMAEETAGDSQKEPPAEEDNSDGDEVDPELLKTEPWEGYDNDKVADIVEGINIYVDDGADDLPDLLAHIWAYESAHKKRVRVLGHLEKIANREGDQDEEARAETPQEEEPQGAPEGTAEDPDSAAHEAGTEGEDGAEEGQEDGQDVPTPDREPDTDAEPDSDGEADEAGAEDRDGADAEEAPAEAERQPEVDDDYRSLISDVEGEISRYRLHTPSDLPEEKPELPFDLTTLSDKQLQQFHGYFSAYAYRATHLLMMEEAKARRCKQAADEMSQELLVRTEKYDDHDKAKTMTVLEAEIESLPDVRKWRRRQRLHDAFAHSYRQERDSYAKMVETLSRLETMRHNEWERSGGGGGRKR